MNADEIKLWKRYLRKSNDTLRNELVIRYMPVAKAIAAKFAASIATIQYGEFLSAASFGLLQAMPKFRLTGGANPKTFLAFRVVGEIKDFLRSQDYLKRTERRALTRVERWVESQFAAGRRVTDDDIVAEFGKLPMASEPRSLATIVAQGQRDSLTIGECLVARAETDSRVTPELLRNLSRNERLIVLLYADGVTMKQIGRELGLSESRVSQMVKELRPRLHASALRYGYGYFFKGDRDELPSRLRKAV
jgi:RNA polymerase sigma factor FliA